MRRRQGRKGLGPPAAAQMELAKQTLHARQQTEGCWKEVGREWARQVTGIKEDTCPEHQGLYVSDESLNTTPEMNITLYVN